MGPVTISYDDFKTLIAGRVKRYLTAAGYLARRTGQQKSLTRPLLGELLSQSSQIEELLDSYGARNNCRWARFRSLTAAIKLFSNVSYELLHIQHSIPAYRLLPVKQDFAKRTEETLSLCEQILIDAAQRLLDVAGQLKLHTEDTAGVEIHFGEVLPPGRLPHDLAMRKIETVSQTVTLLATAFLNLAAESRKALPSRYTEPRAYLCELTGSVSEEKLRSLELRFHNLQSLYDTYVSTTETEVFDKDLPVLRGHISVVLHLLRTARDLAHYYERHASPSAQPAINISKRLIEPEKLLDILINYCISFVSQYLGCAELLCQDMLKRYIEIGHIEVPVPQYRGFHVRPSTLISKLVLHYGSDVKMKMGDDTYDASSPLELFRANEKINAHKRRSLAQEIICLDLVPPAPGNHDVRTIIRNIVMALADRGKVILYEQPLKIEDKPYPPDARLLEHVTDEIAKLQMIGKIDSGTDIRAVFIGDKRVLQDIQLLAETGYGEDNSGNNIPLPERLAYLRQ
ncbi:MAG: HPr family phosphocarrier protein [Planctomycetales bacterium]|nr:HPr family phosphocarrier protein [Planctomycetales bacterium]